VAEDLSIMKIAIIGAGNVGRALGSSLTRAGHDVTIASKSGQTARDTAAAIDAEAARSPLDAVRVADLVVLAVPFSAAHEVADSIAGEVDGRTVVDVTNPIKPAMDGLLHVDGRNGAEQIQSWLPGASVVKAFNTVFASNDVDPTVDGVQLDALVAGDDADAKRQVLDLAESIGFNPVDAGPLSAATPLEYLAFLNIALNATNGWSWRSGWKLVGAPIAA
jgi:8-hydroxy-5-deazaflavin:NADPH oxidoreductase